MKEITTTKRLEVAQLYLLGHPYVEIEAQTGVSHGSIAGIVKEVEDGHLTIPGTPFDQVNDLRQLSLDLRKKGLDPSQALLGVTFFERLDGLGIDMEIVDRWAEVAKPFTSESFPAKEFSGAAIRLHDLEKSTGQQFEDLTEEYRKLRENSEKLKKEVETLSASKTELNRELAPLSQQVETLRKEKQRLGDEIEAMAARMKETGSRVKEAKAEKDKLDKEIKDLQRNKMKLSLTIGNREELLRRLNDIGLSDKELMILRAFVEKTGENGGSDPKQVKQSLFDTLDRVQTIFGLEKAVETETEKVEELTSQESALKGNIKELEKAKIILDAEIASAASTTSEKIRAMGQAAVSEIQQQIADLQTQVDSLVSETLRVGKAVGEMSSIVKRGEDAEKGMENFLEETEVRLGRR